MNVAIDIGNTSIKVGIFEGETLVKVRTVAAEEIPVLLQQETTEHVILSSVGQFVVELKTLPAALQSRIHYLSSDSRMPLTLAYSTPHTLGADRLAAATGAWAACPHSPLLVIDAGTCITIDFVDAEARFRGGAILPGMYMKATALHNHTAQLPLIELLPNVSRPLPEVTGATTEECLLAGILNATLYEVEGFMQQYVTRYPDVQIFLTGGDSDFLHDHTTYPHIHDKYLLMKGLNTILTMNI